MQHRRTDTEFVTDEQLASTRDQIAQAWAVEYARTDSPWTPKDKTTEEGR